MLKSSTEYKIDFIYPKKATELNRCLNGFNISIAFKVIRANIFSAVKKVSFPQSRNFSSFKKLFHSQKTSVKELFHSLGNFPHSRKFSTSKELFHSGNIPQSRNFFTVKEFLHVKEVFPKQSVLHRQKSFLETKIKKVL